MRRQYALQGPEPFKRLLKGLLFLELPRFYREPLQEALPQLLLGHCLYTHDSRRVERLYGLVEERLRPDHLELLHPLYHLPPGAMRKFITSETTFSMFRSPFARSSAASALPLSSILPASSSIFARSDVSRARASSAALPLADSLISRLLLAAPSPFAAGPFPGPVQGG